MSIQRNLFLLFIVAIPLLSACQFTIEPPVVEVSFAEITESDVQLRQLISQHNLIGDPSVGRDIPDIESPLAQLGMKLFFSKALGGDMDSACATCHLPTLAGGDGLSLPIGVGAIDPDLLGPGRTHPSGEPTVPRNSPTTFNVALWDKVLFWDGRVESLGKTPGANGGDGLGIRTPDSTYGVADPLAGDDLVIAQSRFPVTSPDEMRGFEFEVDNDNHHIRKHLAARLGGYGEGASELQDINGWVEEFEGVFGIEETTDELVTEKRIAKALAAYEQSQLFIDTPWKAYVEGNNNAISASAKEGALIFFQNAEEGGANCAECHRGDFFTDEQFHVLAIPQIGPGKEGMEAGHTDYGRFRESQAAEDLYAFRTPSLLNVEIMGPYGHDGAYTTLEGIVRHHLNPAEAIDNYDFGQLDQSIQTEHCVDNTMEVLAVLEENRANGLPSIEDVDLTDGQVDSLIDFLYTLTDPCVKEEACLSPWMPDENDSDPDGLRVQAVTTQ